MDNQRPKMRLTIQTLNGYGIEPGAWRWPGNPADAFMDVNAFVNAAKEAERGKIDAYFLADIPAVTTDLATDPPQLTLEPMITLTAMARETERIGLVATASTTFNDPYTVARQFRALDVVSGGRVGWNAITTSSPAAALNYGAEVPSRRERYERAHEFIAVVMALWGSWPDDALVLDTENGRFAHADKVRPVSVRGQHLFSMGPLGVPPSPQGQPVVFTAGGGVNGLHVAGRFADAVYNNPHDIPTAAGYAAAVGQMAQAYGRNPEHMTVFSGVITSIASSEREAIERRERLDELGDLDSKVVYVGYQLGISLSPEDIDKPIHAELLARAFASPGDPRSSLTLRLAQEGKTIREIIAYGPAHWAIHPVALGTPEHVADMLETWFDAGVGGGFNITPDVASDGVTDFVDQVIPLLQKRGLFRTEYEGTTLRNHLGLPYQNGLPASYTIQEDAAG